MFDGLLLCSCCLGGSRLGESSNHSPTYPPTPTTKHNTQRQVDGGVGVANIKEIAEAGADFFVAGSAILKNPRTQEVGKGVRGLGGGVEEEGAEIGVSPPLHTKRNHHTTPITPPNLKITGVQGHHRPDARGAGQGEEVKRKAQAQGKARHTAQQRIQTSTPPPPPCSHSWLSFFLIRFVSPHTPITGRGAMGSGWERDRGIGAARGFSFVGGVCGFAVVVGV